ncbi:MAG: ABC transporter ATP-binding protein [Solirubrobacterales bacterium]
MPREPAISVEDLRVVRGGRKVLPDISLQVEGGSITGLLGPSGAGKTTLIRAIVGVQIVDSGEVKVLGEPAGSPSLRDRVAYVTQAPSVYADLTVKENLEFFARVLDAPPTRVDEVIATVKLSGQTAQVGGSLSGGQFSRVSLATALLSEPELLVLDEPTTGLDPVLRDELWGAFRGLAAQGVTLLVSSHVMDEAAHCDRLLLLREGELLASETPDALLRRTGSSDLDAAFLRLIESGARRAAHEEGSE